LLAGFPGQVQNGLLVTALVGSLLGTRSNGRGRRQECHMPVVVDNSACLGPCASKKTFFLGGLMKDGRL